MEKLPKRWLTKKEQKMWRAYLAAQFRLTKKLTEELEKSAEIDHLTYEIFVKLSESKDRSMRMTDLAKSVSAIKSKLTYRINQLEEQGFVRRTECGSDGRGQICSLTNKGFSKLENAAPFHVQSVLDAFIEPIDNTDIEHLTEIFNSIAASVQDADN